MSNKIQPVGELTQKKWDAWIQALESEKYKQWIGGYFRKDSFERDTKMCCLTVAAVTWDVIEYPVVDNLDQPLLQSILEEVLGIDMISKCIKMNDTTRLPFKEIAAHLKGYKIIDGKPSKIEA